METYKSYKEQSELNDLRQHANKIIQGIKKLEKSDANRAIWELFQNAVDLNDCECKIEIEIDDSFLRFSHNGEPFTAMTLDCLFKQVSSKTLEEKKEIVEDDDLIGQYGTGFMTTHSFGRKVTINGGIKTEDNTGQLLLKDFIIDRNTDNWTELAGRISKLKEEVGDILRNGKTSEDPCLRTSFTYDTITDSNRDNAKRAMESAALILPYVMVLNSKLVEVKVITSHETTIYKKGDVTAVNGGVLNGIDININDCPQKRIYYLQSTDDKLTVIMPFSDCNDAISFVDEIPRLFLYYPLIGPRNLGINFLIHSKYFQPTEPRDGLYLASDNQENQKEEAANKALLEQASEMIFDYIRGNSENIMNPIRLAKIDFITDSLKEQQDNYFKGLKKEWICNFKDIDLVETIDKRIKPSNAAFMGRELLDDDVFDSAYELASIFWNNLPKKELMKEWTCTVEQWNIEQYNDVDTLEIISIDDLVGKIEGQCYVKFFNIDSLQKFYRYIITSGRSNLFSNHKLLPNIKGEFCKLSTLYKMVYIPKELISIADVIMPERLYKYIDSKFEFNLELSEYNRSMYSKDINDVISKKISDRTVSSELETEYLTELIRYCKISSIENPDNIPFKVVQLACDFYEIDKDLILIFDIVELPRKKENKLDVRVGQRSLVRIFLNDISVKDPNWTKENEGFLLEVMETASSYSEYEDWFKSLPLYPNELYKLSSQDTLTIDDDIPLEIKELYNKVVYSDRAQIESKLVLNSFSEFLKVYRKTIVLDLTRKIEGDFFKEGESIINHPFKKEILDIIQKFKTDNDYKDYFSLIYEKRSKLLVELADGEDTFKILSLGENKIKDLAELASNSSFDEIIKQAKEVLQKKAQEDASFRYKYMLGTHVEKIIREGLASVLSSKVKVENVQNGQDVIIKIGDEDVYFIEIKSIWNTSSSVRMSKNQTLKANREKDCYALCTVNMTKYTGENKDSISSIDEIRDLIWFNTNIGEGVAPLIDLLEQTSDEDSIHLDGDYSTLVPMNFIKRGTKIDDFESNLISFLKDHKAFKNPN